MSVHKNILSIKVSTCYTACNITCYIIFCYILAGAGCIDLCKETAISKSLGHHHKGKETLDINLWKAERHFAVPRAGHGLLQCDNGVAREWVTNQYSTAHPILRWLPSKLAEWIADTELQIPAEKEGKWTVGELNQILANNLVPNGDGGHLRSFTVLQWECEHYNSRQKARCYV